METIKISKSKVQEALEIALKNTRNHPMSGWGIPIYIEDDGRITAGNIISQNIWQPDALEIYRVPVWESDADDNDKDAIDEEIYEMIEHILDEMVRNNDYPGGESWNLLLDK